MIFPVEHSKSEKGECALADDESSVKPPMLQRRVGKVAEYVVE